MRTSLRIDARDFLWNRLQGRQLGGFRFHRDLKIPPHEVDFLCIGRKLVVEVAGEAAVDQDRERSLAEAGYRIVRFREQDVIGRIESVLKVILKVLAERGRR